MKPHPLAILALAWTLAVPAAPAEAQEAATGQVRGVVRGLLDGARAPLAAALVEITSGDVTLSGVADAGGLYRVDGVPGGRASLRVLHVGHDPLEMDVVVPAGGVLVLDVDLQGRPVTMPGVRVVADRGEAERAGDAPDPDADLAEVDIRAIGAGPGLAEAGIAQAARAAVGDDPGDPTDVLFMRGSTTDLKLVLLDGAPVYAPYHVGGILPAFDADLMGAATHYVGGAPARYDGGLSYILDLNTRAPRRDRFASTGAVDLISARATAEVPLGGWGGLMLGGRALHGGEAALLPGRGSPYGYGDGLARLEVDLARGHRLSATGFVNQESVRLDLPGEGVGGAADLAALEAAAGTAGSRGPDARWGNRALSLSYRGTFDRTWATVRAAAGRYDARLPITRRDGDLFARGSTGRIRLTADVTTAMDGWELRYGGSTELTSVTYDAHALGQSGSVLVEDAAEGSVVGGYAEAVFSLDPRLRMWTGVRVDRFSTDGSVRAAPRVKVAWLVSDRAVLSLAAGRYHQYARSSDEVVEEALAGAVDESQQGGGMGPLLPVATASHLVVSMDQMLLPRLRLGLDGFFKSFQGVTGPDQRLNASGADLRVQREGETVTFWLGYSLAWTWTEEAAAFAAPSFTGQHLLSAGVSGRAWSRLGVDLRLGYGDGLPLTAVPVSGSPDAPAAGAVLETAGLARSRQAPVFDPSRSDRFFRLDAEVSGLFQATLGSRPVFLRPYLRVMNALGRRDALFYYFEPWRSDDVEPLVESALLPVVGFEWRF